MDLSKQCVGTVFCSTKPCTPIQITKGKLARAMDSLQRSNWVNLLPTVTYNVNQAFVPGTRITKNQVSTADLTPYLRRSRQKAGFKDGGPPVKERMENQKAFDASGSPL